MGNKIHKIKTDKLTEGFMKLMTDMGATFIDVTPQEKKVNKRNQTKLKIK